MLFVSVRCETIKRRKDLAIVAGYSTRCESCGMRGVERSALAFIVRLPTRDVRRVTRYVSTTRCAYGFSPDYFRFFRSGDDVSPDESRGEQQQKDGFFRTDRFYAWGEGASPDNTSAAWGFLPPWAQPDVVAVKIIHERTNLDLSNYMYKLTILTKFLIRVT